MRGFKDVGVIKNQQLVQLFISQIFKRSVHMVEFHEVYRKLKIAFEVIRGAWGVFLVLTRGPCYPDLKAPLLFLIFKL